MSYAYCSDCKKHTNVVLDHSVGDTVCSECGLVLESHLIDKTPSEDLRKNVRRQRPIRVGGPTNPLLADGGLFTIISKPNGASGDFLSSSLGQWRNPESRVDSPQV